MPESEPALVFETEGRTLDDLRRALCRAALERAGNPTGAARMLGIERDALLDLLSRLRIEWSPRDPSHVPGG